MGSRGTPAAMRYAQWGVTPKLGSKACVGTDQTKEHFQEHLGAAQARAQALEKAFKGPPSASESECYFIQFALCCN